MMESWCLMMVGLQKRAGVRLKIVTKKTDLRKCRLKKTRPAALILLRNVLFQA